MPILVSLSPDQAMDAVTVRHSNVFSFSDPSSHGFARLRQQTPGSEARELDPWASLNIKVTAFLASVSQSLPLAFYPPVHDSQKSSIGRMGSSRYSEVLGILMERATLRDISRVSVDNDGRIRTHFSTSWGSSGTPFCLLLIPTAFVTRCSERILEDWMTDIFGRQLHISHAQWLSWSSVL
jgi:hypothetical protein